MKINAQSSGPGADTYYVTQYGRGGLESDYPVIRRYSDHHVICVIDQSETCAHAVTVTKALKARER